MKVGELRAAFSVKAPVDELVANASANSRMLFVASLLTLIAACTAIALVIRRTVVQPISRVKDLLQNLAKGDLTRRMEVTSEDELGQMATALNATMDTVSEVIGAIKEESVNVANASEEFSAVSQQISANSEETSAQANVVTSATEQVNRSLQTVANGTEEVSLCIKEISNHATQAAKVADGAMKTAAETNAIVAKLGELSAEIGQVIKVITSIAQKTDLLALNATVEAARAGEVGAGFAVVANGVKELAKQTATATEDISRKIEAIQTEAKSAVAAIASISGVIGQLSEISVTIATAMEEQAGMSSEISRTVSDAAKGSAEVAQNIQGVAQAAQSTSQGATDSQKAAKNLAEMSTHLRGLVDQFRLDRDRKNGRGTTTGGAKQRTEQAVAEELEEEFSAK